MVGVLAVPREHDKALVGENICQPQHTSITVDQVWYTLIISGRAGGAAGRERMKITARRRETLLVQRRVEMLYGTGHTVEIRCAARVVGDWDETP